MLSIHQNRALWALGAFIAFAQRPVCATLAIDEHQPAIYAGALPDTPGDRVDPNTTTSRYAGVGSVRINSPQGTFIGSGTPISPYHIVTAGHNVDLSGDGLIDVAPGNIIFNVNYGGNLTSSISASALTIHPDFDGFNVPTGVVNDDIAVITLSSPLPAGVPIYSLLTTQITSATTFTMVGYGQSGSGATGLSVAPSFSTKRVGYNNLDALVYDDEGGPDAEVWYYDFDGPIDPLYGLLPNGPLGGVSLPNDEETTIGGGDSGGPAFVEDGAGNLLLAGTLDFTTRFLLNTPTGPIQGPAAPLFGSGGGGMLIYPYLDFLLPFLATVPEANSILLVGLVAVGALASTKLGRCWQRKNGAPDQR